MKLRNKKTGAIYDVFLREREVGGYPCIIVCDKKAYRQSKTKFGVTNYVLDEYSSLIKLNDDWEDVDVTNATNIPLIKDEKIRKAVRAWAEASGITKVLSYGDYFWIGFRSVNTESVWKFECSYSDALEFELDKEYTISELCGEEEE